MPRQGRQGKGQGSGLWLGTRLKKLEYWIDEREARHEALDKPLESMTGDNGKRGEAM